MYIRWSLRLAYINLNYSKFSFKLERGVKRDEKNENYGW